MTPPRPDVAAAGRSAFALAAILALLCFAPCKATAQTTPAGEWLETTIVPGWAGPESVELMLLNDPRLIEGSADELMLLNDQRLLADNVFVDLALDDLHLKMRAKHVWLR